MPRSLSRWLTALLFVLALAPTWPATAQSLRGDPAAVTAAQRMIAQLGGAERWASAQSLHLVEESYSGGSDTPTRDVYRRDLTSPRIRADFPEGPLVMTSQWAWARRNGRIDIWPPERVTRFADGWGANLYVLYARLARGDPALILRSVTPRRFEIIDNATKVAEIETTVGGTPVLWRRFSAASPESPTEEWIYGPLRDFGDVRLPAWGARTDGSERMAYQSARLSEEPLSPELFPAPPGDRE